MKIVIVGPFFIFKKVIIKISKDARVRENNKEIPQLRILQLLQAPKGYLYVFFKVIKAFVGK